MFGVESQQVVPTKPLNAFRRNLVLGFTPRVILWISFWSLQIHCKPWFHHGWIEL